MSSAKIASLIDEAVAKAKEDSDFAAALKADPQQTVKETFNYALSDAEADEFIAGVMRQLLEEMIEQRRASSASGTDDDDPVGDALKTAFSAAVDGARELYRQARPLAQDAYDRAADANKRFVDAIGEANGRAADEFEDLYDKTKPVVEQTVSETVGTAEKAYRRVMPLFEDAFDHTVSTMENAYRKTRPVVEEVTEQATARAEEVYRKTRPLMQNAAKRIRRDMDTAFARGREARGGDKPVDVEVVEDETRDSDESKDEA